MDLYLIYLPFKLGNSHVHEKIFKSFNILLQDIDHNLTLNAVGMVVYENYIVPYFQKFSNTFL